MNETIDFIIQAVFLIIGLGLGGWLLYYAFHSPGKNQNTRIDTDDLEVKKK